MENIGKLVVYKNEWRKMSGRLKSIAVVGREESVYVKTIKRSCREKDSYFVSLILLPSTKQHNSRSGYPYQARVVW
ncbi:hypothetical protein D5086_017013 [Populus alba]|uniref:Uncharacterized protein n=1 Tax=Populus alba TaxID=43335 RepID=A0ACC4BXD0_POPAL